MPESCDPGQADGDGAQFLAGRPPDVGRTCRVSFRRREQGGIVLAEDDEVVLQREDAAFAGLQAIAIFGDFGGVRDGAAPRPDVDAGTVRAILRSADDDGRREAGGGIAEARREIGGGGILRGSGMRGYDNLAGDEIDDVVAVGVGEHPAGGERVGEMTGAGGSG